MKIVPGLTPADKLEERMETGIRADARVNDDSVLDRNAPLLFALLEFQISGLFRIDDDPQKFR
jgi:hypothetical protein